MTQHRTRGRHVDIQLALIDDEYYAAVHRKLKGDARKRFERAVDDAWREREAPQR